jgi:sulfate adenylyltransferase
VTGFGPPDTGVTLQVPVSVAMNAAAAGRLVLTDDEGAPLAELDVAGTYDSPAGPGTGIIGPVHRVARREGRLFERLYRSPADVHTGGQDVLTVPVERPLTSPDLAHIAEAAGQRTVLLLVLAGHGRPRGVSVEELIRGTLAAAALLPAADVVAVPLARRDDQAHDQRLRARVIAAYAPGSVLEPGLDGPLNEEVASAINLFSASGAGQGLVVLLTGLSGSGKSTIARGLREALLANGRGPVTMLDGDVVRRHLATELGFSRSDRDTNVRRIGWVAAEISRHGGTVIACPIAPFADTRRAVRDMVEAAGGAFLLVHVATPLEECERRDRKGLYAKARTGEISDFTGISSPYEEPVDADLRIDTTGREVPEAVSQVLTEIRRRGLIARSVIGALPTAALMQRPEAGRWPPSCSPSR